MSMIYIVVAILIILIISYIFIVRKLLMKLRNKDMAKEFIIVSILIFSTVSLVITAFGITTNYLAVIITISGLLFFNHSVQPFFSPLIVEKQSKDIYLIRFTKDLSINGDFNLYKTDNYTIKLPLIALFKKIKIHVGTGLVIFDPIRYHTDPFIITPTPTEDSIVLELKEKIDAWFINKIDYQISYGYKIEDSVIKEIEHREAGPIGLRPATPLFETTHFNMISEDIIIGVLVEVLNPLSMPFKTYHQTIKDLDFWKDANKNFGLIYYENRDEIYLSEGRSYCIISDLGPYEKRSYYIYSNKKSWCIANGKKFMAISWI